MKQPLNEEFRRMQKLAGIITEGLEGQPSHEEELQNYLKGLPEGSDEYKIAHWYLKMNPEIDNLSAEQELAGIKSYVEEWNHIKNNPEDYPDYYSEDPEIVVYPEISDPLEKFTAWVEEEGDWYSA